MPKLQTSIRIIAAAWLLFGTQALPETHAWTLTGKVIARARPRALTAAVPPPYHAECGKSKPLPQFQIGAAGTVKNVVVWLDPLDDASASWPQAPATQGYRLDQKQCEFSPHVLLAAPEVPVYIMNSDPLAHNVGLSFGGKAIASVTLPKQGMLVKKTFHEPGPHLVQCGIHPWMSAVVFVQKHGQYRLTSEDGTFLFEGLPKGRYLLRTWHEGFGPNQITVTPESGPVSVIYPANPRKS